MSDVLTFCCNISFLCLESKLGCVYVAFMHCTFPTSIPGLASDASSFLVLLLFDVTYRFVSCHDSWFDLTIVLPHSSADHGSQSSGCCGSLPRITRRWQWTHWLSEGKGKSGGQTPWEDVSGVWVSVSWVDVQPAQTSELTLHDLDFSGLNYCYCSCLDTFFFLCPGDEGVGGGWETGQEPPSCWQEGCHPGGLHNTPSHLTIHTSVCVLRFKMLKIMSYRNR